MIESDLNKRMADLTPIDELAYHNPFMVSHALQLILDNRKLYKRKINPEMICWSTISEPSFGLNRYQQISSYGSHASDYKLDEIMEQDIEREIETTKHLGDGPKIIGFSDCFAAVVKLRNRIDEHEKKLKDRYRKSISRDGKENHWYDIPFGVDLMVYDEGKLMTKLRGPIKLKLSRLEGRVINAIHEDDRPYYNSEKRVVNGELVDSCG